MFEFKVKFIKGLVRPRTETNEDVKRVNSKQALLKSVYKNRFDDQKNGAYGVLVNINI